MAYYRVTLRAASPTATLFLCTLKASAVKDTMRRAEEAARNYLTDGKLYARVMVTVDPSETTCGKGYVLWIDPYEFEVV